MSLTGSWPKGQLELPLAWYGMVEQEGSTVTIVTNVTAVSQSVMVVMVVTVFLYCYGRRRR